MLLKIAPKNPKNKFNTQKWKNVLFLYFLSFYVDFSQHSHQRQSITHTLIYILTKSQSQRLFLKEVIDNSISIYKKMIILL